MTILETNNYSLSFALLGVRHRQVVAVTTVHCGKHRQDVRYLIQGAIVPFEDFWDILEPIKVKSKPKK